MSDQSAGPLNAEGIKNTEKMWEDYAVLSSFLVKHLSRKWLKMGCHGEGEQVINRNK